MDSSCKKHIIIILCVLFLFFSCTPNKALKIKWVTTTMDSSYIANPSLPLGYAQGVPDVNIHLHETEEEVLGFGATFSVSGWEALSLLKESERKHVMQALFSKEGLNLIFCLTPIGASVFTDEWYSYDEKENDFHLDEFSIEKDEETLIPFIKEAQKIQPDLYLLALPWSPPSWMKKTKHYANGDITGNKQFYYRNKNDENHLIGRDKYYKSYALYYKKYIEAYRKAGINIDAVAIQNNLCKSQSYPSCVWDEESVHTLVDNYLGPDMDSLGVRLMLGSFQNTSSESENVLSFLDAPSAHYYTMIGADYTTRGILDKMRDKYSSLRYIQMKQEVSSGDNTWTECFKTWESMKTGFLAGSSSYIYNNIALPDSLDNHWEMRGNSLVSVDTHRKKVRFNPEYFLLKHCSHYLQPGAKRVKTSGTYNNLLAFINPDKSLVIILVNTSLQEESINIGVRTQMFSAPIKPRSINTFLLPNKFK